MDSYLREKFWWHQAINGTFIRFLMRHMADQTLMGLKTTVDNLKASVAELKKRVNAQESDGSKKVTQDMFNQLESKLENVIKANNLKKYASQNT
jgi:hypothetical protein